MWLRPSRTRTSSSKLRRRRMKYCACRRCFIKMHRSRESVRRP